MTHCDWYSKFSIFQWENLIYSYQSDTVVSIFTSTYSFYQLYAVISIITSYTLYNQSNRSSQVKRGDPSSMTTPLTITNNIAQLERAPDLKIEVVGSIPAGCGFDSWSGQPNSY